MSLKSVAKAINSPMAYTGKILQLLSKHNIIESVKGARGGYEITGANGQILKIANIVNAIDGDHFYTGCALGLKKCNAAKPCPLHFQFVKIRKELTQMLEKTELNSLTGEAFYLSR